MFLNYGRNPFVQKIEDPNNRIYYRFRFRGEEVCITLSPDPPYISLCVDGNGRQQWLKEATPILDKQCEVNYL